MMKRLDDDDDDDDDDEEAATFNSLPPEIHLLVCRELTYPDALSLKHTSRYFYRLVDTGVRLKVAWLMQRRMLHLDCPNDKKCILKTDLEFCRGSVRYFFNPPRGGMSVRTRGQTNNLRANTAGRNTDY